MWIILDEFPLASILDGDGEINADRYPGFAELASVTTWYRNASSTYNNTHRAVPDQLTGVISPGDQLPRYQDHPRNVFTLFGGVIPIERYESVTDLCPPSVCDPPPPRPLSQAFRDAAIVYGHRVLPPAGRDHLPAIDTSWGDFGAERETGEIDPAEMTDGELIDAAVRAVAGDGRRREEPARPGRCAGRAHRRHRRRTGVPLRARGLAAPAVGAGGVGDHAVRSRPS